MTTLREAAQQALEALRAMNPYPASKEDQRASALAAPLDALAQQDEPLNLADPAVQKRLATQWGYVPAAQAEPVEPVAWVNQANLDSARIARDRGGQGDTHTWSETRSSYHGVPLYAAPPQRKLVPLTEAEIEHIGITHQSLRQVARAVERAVWEKNNG
jgi:hypothetical protein